LATARGGSSSAAGTTSRRRTRGDSDSNTSTSGLRSSGDSSTGSSSNGNSNAAPLLLSQVIADYEMMRFHTAAQAIVTKTFQLRDEGRIWLPGLMGML